MSRYLCADRSPGSPAFILGLAPNAIKWNGMNENAAESETESEAGACSSQFAAWS